MMLREKILQAIRSANGDDDKAALAVCFVLEDSIDLGGNGWWDDDTVAKDYIESVYKRRAA